MFKEEKYGIVKHVRFNGSNWSVLAIQLPKATAVVALPP